MKKQLHYIGIITLAMVMFLSMQGFAQELEPGEILPELNEEQKIARFTTNLTAMVFVILNYADQHGQSIEEAGKYFGELFADSWSADTTPESYVSGMSRNWQMYDLRTEVLEVGEDYVTARRDIVQFGDEIDEAYQEMFGYSSSDFDKFFRYIEKGITSELGLELSQSVEDDYVVFTVSR